MFERRTKQEHHAVLGEVRHCAQLQQQTAQAAPMGDDHLARDERNRPQQHDEGLPRADPVIASGPRSTSGSITVSAPAASRRGRQRREQSDGRPAWSAAEHSRSRGGCRSGQAGCDRLRGMARRKDSDGTTASAPYVHPGSVYGAMRRDSVARVTHLGGRDVYGPRSALPVGLGHHWPARRGRFDALRSNRAPGRPAPAPRGTARGGHLRICARSRMIDRHRIVVGAIDLSAAGEV